MLRDHDLKDDGLGQSGVHIVERPLRVVRHYEVQGPALGFGRMTRSAGRTRQAGEISSPSRGLDAVFSDTRRLNSMQTWGFFFKTSSLRAPAAP